jgi:hypothetical protein
LSANLGPIPAEERRALLAEFQKSQTSLQPSQPDLVSSNSAKPRVQSNVETQQPGRFADGLSQSTDAASNNFLQADSATTQPQRPGWTQMSVEALVRFVKHERPNLVATIIQQLPAQQGAQLLQRLPRHLAKDTLRCLGDLRELDPETKQELDIHLTQRLEEYYQSLQHQRENTRRINELLSAAPPDLKQQWASWLRPDEFTDPDERLTGSVHSEETATSRIPPDSLMTSDAVTNVSIVNTASIQSADHATADRVTNSILPFDTDLAPKPLNPSRPATLDAVDQYYRHHDNSIDTDHLDHAVVLQEFERILGLGHQQLASLLSGLDSQTVLLSLAGATPQFMKRFYAMLEPADAKVLQNRIKRIGPVHLREIDRAQMRVIESCRKLKEPLSVSRVA